MTRYLERCRLKTAVLFRAACELGALEADTDPDTLGAFGERIGLAFQLLDDVLDVSGPPERTGKPRGADLLDGTVTLPLILARQRDPELAALDLRTVRTAPEAAAACERIAATGALDDARGVRAGSSPRPRTSCRRCRRVSGPRSSLRPTSSSSASRRSAGRFAASMGPRGPVRTGIGSPPTSTDAERSEAQPLEIFRKDVVGVQGGDEPIDLIGHVRLRQPLEVPEHVGQALVEPVLELAHLVLGVEALGVPVAVRAGQQQVPGLVRSLGPVDRLHQLGGAVGAHVQPAGGMGLVAPPDHLDAAPAGKDDASD